MTLNKILTAFLICLAALKISYAQDSSSAVLVDELASVPCNEFWARLDGLFVELGKDPQSKGYIVIYGKDNKLLGNLLYEGWSNGIIDFSNYNKTRIEIVRGALGEERKIQFWKVSPGQTAPEFRKEDWSYSVPASSKPFIFGNYRELDLECPTRPPTLKNYADLILANRNARGHLVVRAGTEKEIRKTEREVLGELVTDYKVPRNRLKVFYVKEKGSRSSEADVELWFVP